MIADQNAWLGGIFWRDRDLSFTNFAANQSSKKSQAATVSQWPGANVGVRPPMRDETALSDAEVPFLQNEVCFD